MSTKKDYTRRDDAIVLHVAAYVATSKKVISNLFFEGKECGHVLTRLESQGLIKIHSKAISGRYSFLTITPKGAVKAGYPKERGQLTGKVIDDRLGLTFACFLDVPHRRYLLPNSEANRLLDATGCVPTNVDVIAADEPNAFGVYRCYRAENAKAAIDGLRNLYASFQQDAAIQKAMTAGVFGVAVLARSQKLCQQLQSTLQSNRNPLGKDCLHFVALAPSVDTFGACVKNRRNAA